MTALLYTLAERSDDVVWAFKARTRYFIHSSGFSRNTVKRYLSQAASRGLVKAHAGQNIQTGWLYSLGDYGHVTANAYMVTLYVEFSRTFHFTPNYTSESRAYMWHIVRSNVRRSFVASRPDYSDVDFSLLRLAVSDDTLILKAQDAMGSSRK